MSNFNHVILIGHISREPILAYLPSQTPVCDFALAVNSTWKDAAGAKKEAVMFIDCVLYGKRAEAFNKYLKKGSPVQVVGKLVLDKWQAQDGGNRQKHKIHVADFYFMASGKGGDDNADNS